MTSKSSSFKSVILTPLVGLRTRMEAYVKMSNTRTYRDKQFKFLGASMALALALVLTLPRDQGAEATTEQQSVPLVAVVPQFDLTRHDLYLEDVPSVATDLKSLTLKYGDSLGPLLQKNGVDPQVAYNVTKAFSDVFDPRKLRVGHTFNLYFEGDALDHVTFKPDVDKTVFVSRKTDEEYIAKSVAAEFKMETVAVKASIENSLYLDANTLGAPDKVIQQFANIYEYSVDFQRDIQPGDEFEMFFEVARDKNGKMIKAGDLLYTSFSPRGKTLTYYLFEDSKGKENFYDEKGKTAKRKLRATPVNGARLSSSFGRRKHPILGYRKMHTGVDFAAPRGTPILAAGSGTIERANRFGSFGNYVRIRHTDGYKTAYAHMKGFARGIRKGAYVRQDQVIGYVGTTGRSTGPHLHYEVIHNGRKINPRRLSQLSGKPLSKKQMPAFVRRRTEIDALRAKSETIMRSEPEAVLSAEIVKDGEVTLRGTSGE